MKCGCSVDGSDASGDCYIDSEDCLLPEAIAIIKSLVLASAWKGTKVYRDAEVFVQKVENEGKV